MIVILVKYKTQSAKTDDAVKSLIRLIEQVKEEPHFKRIKMLINTDDKAEILLYEEWDDVNYYQNEHMNTPHLQQFISESGAFLAGPPEITKWNPGNEFKAGI